MNDAKPAAALSVVGDGTSGWVYAFADGKEIVDVTYSDVPGPWIFHVQGRMVQGKPAITHLTIAPRDTDSPQAITRDTVRRAPTGTLLSRVKSALREKWSNKAADLHTQARIQSVKAGRSWPAEHYMQVAWFAIDAELTDKAPRQVIQDQWNVSGITASRWLARARKLGYLPDYPLTPADGRPTEGHQADATRIVEEQIVGKVLQEGFVGNRHPSEISTAIGAIFHRSIFGTSEQARTMRTEIFVETLANMSEEFPDNQVKAAAGQLLALLTADLPPSST
ncbi:hypothetical protein ACWGI1_02440 [Streptomyces sp. NPDC054835]|uniref:hypothetical protein n=1 Tax=Streptomyces exfoliatus TaxID=1905 RepID=UPI000464DC67|nr:hypothetical protein [Streptomyces exfoliatus]